MEIKPPQIHLGGEMEKFESKSDWDGYTELLRIDRSDAHKGRVREGDIIIDLPRGEEIRSGDVFGPSSDGTYFRIEINPEDVLNIKLTSGSDDLGSALQLGYLMGSRHMEVLIDGNEAFVPMDLPRSKLESFLQDTGLNVETKIMQRTIADNSGYFRGEEHAH